MCVRESKITNLAYLLISQMERHLFFLEFLNVKMTVTYVAIWHNKEWSIKNQMFQLLFTTSTIPVRCTS